jgi:transcription-repair coupling factor (superfamily II helicase)
VANITETELFGELAQQRRDRSRTQRDHASVIRDLTDLHPGAPVVHEDHGVGRYRGLERLSVGGRDGEFLAIEYADGDRLYVPVGQMHLVSRYTGASDEGAPLHRLGGEQWQRIRRKAAEKVRDVAAELLEVQARREARRREPVELDERMYQDFAATFPFEETPDQRAAIEQVLADLQSPRPMDRVVCGDVGFGKTEVALRAAFAVAQAGRQAAVLVPTTLLAGQHFETFRDRFADWPVRVEMLSRFRAGKATRKVIEGLEDGTVDVVIGTHRLLQQGIRFKNLGLVIVDEEQRFGVRQKERLKSLRAEVDLLTLTATPIPRTLNMSLSGLRDLSLIATAPAFRLAVKTFVQQWDGAAVREACLREIQRGGQVYFLHNDVQSIQRVAREVEELVPEARVRVAHGQMPERELEQVMLDFYRQRFNVLVCTTIIENGIDIPSANTIIMNRADKLGLAQLHQLRGRVGRSHHRAYAYLIVPERRAMTADAQKRVEAVASLEELGSGFSLATHDLEIRGAGEVLGEDQSGQIEEIGFSLYNDLLERAVAALKAGEIPDLDAPVSSANDVDLHIPALIPDDYLPDVHTRLILYKRIASAKTDEALRELQVEMIDRFGLLPQPVKNLFAVASLRRRAGRLGITRLEFGEHGGRIEFKENPAVDPATLIQLVQERPDRYAFEGDRKLRIHAEYPEADQRRATAEELLGRLGLRQAA